MSSRKASSQSESLLETFGNPNYRKLTAQSLKNLERRYAQAKEKEKARTLSRVSMLSVIEEEEEAEARIPDVELLDGKPAPKKFGKFPKKQFGMPIEELDDARSIDRVSEANGFKISGHNQCLYFLFDQRSPLSLVK